LRRRAGLETVRAHHFPDGHFKFPHLWPLKLPQAGRVGLWVFQLPLLTVLHDAGGLVEMAWVVARFGAR
jgi:hypothetical protein